MIETLKIYFNNNYLNDLDNSKIYNIEDIKELNIKYGLSFDNNDIEYISKYINNWNNKLFVLFDLSQSNSEHCRHNFFNGRLYINNKELNHTLFDLVKEPYKTLYNNNLVAFNDNSSVIKGYNSKYFYNNKNIYKKKRIIYILY